MSFKFFSYHLHRLLSVNFISRTQWFLAGMSIALSVQLSQPVAAAVSVGKTVQTAQTNSSEAAETALKQGVQLY